MNDLLFSLVVVLLGTIVTATRLHRYRRVEGQLLMISFSAHILAACGIVWVSRIYYGGVSDLLMYYNYGVSLSGALARDFVGVAPEAIKLILQLRAYPGVEIGGTGTSTGTISGFAGFLLLLLNDSIYATCIVIGFASFAGKLAIYRVFRETWPERFHIRMLVATMLVPSAVFWSSGITKEAFALSGLGYLFLGLHRLIGQKRIGVPMVLGGGLMVGLVKAYILLPFVAAGALWYYWVRSMPKTGDLKIKPTYLILGVGAVITGVLLVGWVFPRFSVTTVAPEVARLQGVGQTIQAGSNYSIANESTKSLAGQLAFAPIALVTALFRPAFFEVRNSMMLLNAIETTTITGLLLWAVWTRRWTWMWSTVLRSPTMMFCFVFTLVLGVGVGLGSTNLGTLSRYRMPMMPFYVALVLVWSAPVQERVRTAADGRAQGEARRPIRNRLETPTVPDAASPSHDPPTRPSANRARGHRP